MSTMLAVTIVILACSMLVRANSDTSIHFPEDYEEISSQNEYLSGAFSAPSISTSLTDKTVHEQDIEQAISRGIVKLSLAINKAYQDRTHNDNIVFAPLDITGALALILLGSNGKTFEELASVLGFATGFDLENKSEKVHEELGRIIRKVEATAGIVVGQQVNFAGAVFVQNNYPIRTLYKETVENIYQSEVLNVDFRSNPVKASQLINAWVSDRTNGKITEILADVPSPATKVIIASAMYFKAKWEKPFLEGMTTRRPFYPNGRKSSTDVEVEMMANAGDFLYYKDNNLGCEILGFPYQGNASVMYVVMPFNSNVQKLKEFEEKLTESDLDNLAGNAVYTKALVLFPKMKIESTTDLKSILRILGVNSLFSPSEANLGLISPGDSLPLVRSSDFAVNPIAPFYGNPNDVLIFSRVGETVNCSSIFDPKSNVTTCQDTISGPNGQQKVTYKKFGEKVGRRIAREAPNSKLTSSRITRTITNSRDTIDSLRNLINQQSKDNNYQNPGLYADRVIHKVYMDITETGTEAAASTLVSLYKSFGGISFRVDVPFLFFIRHEDTKTIMFWGSVDKPTPNFRKGS